MKNFTFKLLQQLNQKKADKGFTLIELLVVIIIIGILSAIALPAFLNQANKARQSEAKQAIGAINRGQQAYFLEKQYFSTTIDGLGLGLDRATPNYSYGSTNNGETLQTTAENGATQGGDASPKAIALGEAGYTSYAYVYGQSLNQGNVRDYIGVAFAVSADASNEATTSAVLCEEADLATTAANLAITATEFADGVTPTEAAGVLCTDTAKFTNARVSGN